jgi:hypothetical protein
MPVRLGRAAMIARVEKGEKTLLVTARVRLPSFQDSVGCLEIVLFQNVCLFLIRFCGKDKVLRDYRKLVEDEEMGWVRCWDIGQV